MSRQARALFDLAVEIVRVHERSLTPGHVTVIPVLVDDLRVALPVLQALATVFEGTLLHADAPELQYPVPGTDDPVRLEAVRAGLTTVPYGESRRVELHVTGDIVEADLVDPGIGPTPSRGERTVLALARAAVHRDLDRVPFAVISFSEQAVDLPFRQAAWSLVVDQLAGIANRRLQTLVVAVETSIDIGMHCQRGRGFRLAIEGSRLLLRRSADDLVVEAGHIARSRDPFVLFLGAGFGASTHLPLGNALRDSAIRRLLNIPTTDPASSDDLATRFHHWISERPTWLTDSEAAMSEAQYVRQLTLEQVIRSEKRFDAGLPTLVEFKAHHDRVLAAPGGAARDLGAILAAPGGRPILVEVNFDQLVETAARNSGVDLEVFYSDADFVRAAAYVRDYLAGRVDRIPLLKLHGDIGDLDTCVVSAEQTEQGVGDGKLQALRALLPADGQPKRLWVYVGASMRDRDLVPILLGEEFGRGIDERWVNPFLLDTIEAFAAERLPVWRADSATDRKRIDERLITETADEFFAAWLDILS